MKRVGYTKLDRPGALSVILGAGLWGLFWIPLRYLDDAGVHGLWAIVMVLLFALLPAIMFTRLRGEVRALGNADTWLIGLSMGLAMALYFVGILFSDVVRVIFLFYLLPVWTSLSAWLIYREPIKGSKLVVIIAALLGLWLLLGGGHRLPVPDNIGDWSAILSGMCWGVSLSMLRGRQAGPAFACTAVSLFIAVVFCAVSATMMVLIPGLSSLPLPALDAIQSTLLAAVLFGALAIFPALLGQIWGARRIPAPTAALLTMIEILVATLSASWLIGTDLTAVAWFGGLIIVMAVCLDLYLQFRPNGPPHK